MTRERVLLNRRRLLRSAAAGAVTLAAPAIVRAESDLLKVGVLLPRSGYEASIGQDCQRGVEIAPGILKSLGLPTIAIMNADTESSVDTARARAEKLIGEGAQLLVGAFDFRADDRRRPGCRTERCAARHQYRGFTRYHRAGLQVRVQEFSHRANDP